MILVLSRDGTPVLQPVFYGERQTEAGGEGDGVGAEAGAAAAGGGDLDAGGGRGDEADQPGVGGHASVEAASAEMG